MIRETSVPVRDVLPDDCRLADHWRSAEGDEKIDLQGERLGEAVQNLLDDCANDKNACKAIQAGSIVLSDEPDTEKFYEWTVKIRISAIWVADGFDLDADRLHTMVWSDLAYASADEIETEIVSAPDPHEIRAEQGYYGVAHD